MRVPARAVTRVPPREACRPTYASQRSSTKEDQNLDLHESAAGVRRS